METITAVRMPDGWTGYMFLTKLCAKHTNWKDVLFGVHWNSKGVLHATSRALRVTKGIKNATVVSKIIVAM
jgi:hypothetical protein